MDPTRNGTRTKNARLTRLVTARMAAGLVTLSLALCALRDEAAFGRSQGAEPAPPQGSQAATGNTARLVGTIQSVAGHTVTLKPDSGTPVVVQIQDSTRLVRVEPGQKDLKGATVIKFEDLQAGDRVLVRGAASPDGKSLTATSVIVMKQTAIAEQRQHEQEDWQRRGVGGLVNGVDPASHVVTISTMTAGGVKKIAIHVSKDTVLRRYAPDSVRFADAKPGTFDEIAAGDQVRARGAGSADGSEVVAEEIVSGRFLNVAGTISAVDASTGQISVMDLATKSSVLVKVTLESQLHRLPPTLAQMIAARLKGGQEQPGGASGPRAADDNRPAAGARGNHGAESAPDAAGGARLGGTGSPPDLQQFLNRLPPVTLADLQRGEAVMIVATPKGASPAVTAITLLSGVEPILASSPSGARSGLLSAWSLGAPGGEGGGEAQ